MKPKPICTPSGTSRVQNVSNWQHVFQNELKVFAVVKFTAGLQKIIHVLKKKNKGSIVNLTLTPFVEKFQLKSVQRYLGVLQRKPLSFLLLVVANTHTRSKEPVSLSPGRIGGF